MADLNLQAQKDATAQLGNIPFSHLIGAPLNAAIEAQGRATNTTLEFIEAVAFNDDKSVRNITLEYQDGDVKRELVVPILTILPIPYIRIDDMTINFKASISASSSTSDQTTASKSFAVGVKASASYWFAKAEFSASYSSKKDSKSSADSKYSVEYTVDIFVRAMNDDMPAGMSKVLGMLTESIGGKGTGGGSGGGGGTP